MIAYYGDSVFGLLYELGRSVLSRVRGERWRPCRKCGANLSNSRIVWNPTRYPDLPPGERNCFEGGTCEWDDEKERRKRWGAGS